MKILFVHQNFPGQFKHLAPALKKQGHEVMALAMRRDLPAHWQDIELVQAKSRYNSTQGIHPWAMDIEAKLIGGEACFHAALELREKGYEPDAIIAHPGWGESLFLKDVWPQSRLGVYCEYYYRAGGTDVGFDPEFPVQRQDVAPWLRVRNLSCHLQFEDADAGISPTHWQASTFPEDIRPLISVIHDGIDTNSLAPNASAALNLKSRSGQSLSLSGDQEIITFANRNLEPYRGYHIFMRALPSLLSRRPNARVVIVGGDKTGYGKPPPKGTWKQKYIDEVRYKITPEDWARVHFIPRLPYNLFVSFLQLSSVHVYLTYPFVLGWSLLEAMSVGCAVVASDTKPLHEAIRHGETGRLVDFFDVQGLVDEVCDLLDTPLERKRLGMNAREFARHHYDLNTRCLPAQLEWVQALVDG